MTGIITGLLCRISDGARVRAYLLTDAPYHDPALASLIEYGTALPVIPRQAGLSISEQISFQPQGGSNNVSASNIPLINAEGYFDDWGGWILSGLDQTIKRGYADQPWSEWTLLFDGRGRGKPEFIGRDRVLITIRDRFAYMSQPVAQQVFSKDDVSNTKLINTTVPLVFGSAYQVKPLLTEPQILRYAVGANTADVPAVQEGGNPSTPIFEYVPLGFQLFQSPTLQITCDVTGPPAEGWQESDVLQGIGGFDTWTSGVPDGWELTEDAPDSTITEDPDGALVQYTAAVDGTTGWFVCGAWSTEGGGVKKFTPYPGTDTLADVLAADDGTYARVEADYGVGYWLTGSAMSASIPANTGPVSVDVKITIETSGGGQDCRLEKLQLTLPDGTVRNMLPPSITYVPTTKTTLTFSVDNYASGPYRLTKEILESPDFGIQAVVRRVSGSSQTVKVHEVALRVDYGTLIERSRLTTDSDLLTVGNRYQLRIYTVGGSGDSIFAQWGTVADHAADIPSGSDGFLETSAQLEGEDVHEFSVIAEHPRFAIEFDRGSGNGQQTIKKIELLDKTASRERYTELMKYIHETADRDPDEVCDTDSFALVQEQAGNPRLGWYVSDQTTRDQLAVLFSHSLGATCWGGIDGKYHAAQMRVPQQPSGEYLSIEGSFDVGHARPDRGEDLRDRVHAARNVHPLRGSETAGVTSTWPEEQRQLVIDKWRITEKADWSDLSGYPTLTLTALDPNSGDPAGGTNVTATGTGFSAFNSGAGDTFTVGGNPVSNLTVVSDTEITFDTPASDGGATGSVDVVVTVGGESATLVGGFEYVATLSYEDEVLADSPFGYWKLDETSGTVASDASGNGRDGEYKGSFTLSDSPVVSGMPNVVRTERSGYIEVPNSAFGSTGFTKMTVEFWASIHTNSVRSDNYTITHDASGSNQGDASFRMNKSAGGLEWVSQSNGDLSVLSSSNVWDGTVHHCVMTYDGSEYLLYVDGVEVASLSSSGKTEWDGTQPLQISGVLDGDARFSPGQIIGHVAIYDHALSAQRVLDHYNAGTA